ncbi:G-protein alpha subunit-domain-containing protein [Aspergillus pseudoustus]|uniref:G-protein alpha subunit-domain-containing protein n=1 Tax=Aspergillus pseudoustus TaxID=1810923 RepID=A0ABR4IMS0_9EURO
MDPLSTVSAVGAILGILEVTTRSIRTLSDLQSRYANIGLRARILVGQLSTLHAALGQVKHLLDILGPANPDAPLSQISVDITNSLDCCQAVITILDQHLSRMQKDQLTVRDKTGFLWHERETADFQSLLNNQVNAGQRIESAPHCTPMTRFLQTPESRSTFSRIKDDASSLLWLRDADSEMTHRTNTTDSLGLVNTRFAFDRDLFSSRAYRVAAMSSMTRALTRKATALRTQDSASIQPDDVTERHVSMTDHERRSHAITSNDTSEQTDPGFASRRLGLPTVSPSAERRPLHRTNTDEERSKMVKARNKATSSEESLVSMLTETGTSSADGFINMTKVTEDYNGPKTNTILQKIDIKVQVTEAINRKTESRRLSELDGTSSAERHRFSYAASLASSTILAKKPETDTTRFTVGRARKIWEESSSCRYWRDFQRKIPRLADFQALALGSAREQIVASLDAADRVYGRRCPSMRAIRTFAAERLKSFPMQPPKHVQETIEHIRNDIKYVCGYIRDRDIANPAEITALDHETKRFLESVYHLLEPGHIPELEDWSYTKTTGIAFEAIGNEAALVPAAIFCDLSGQEKGRDIWQHVFPGASHVFYFVDAGSYESRLMEVGYQSRMVNSMVDQMGLFEVICTAPSLIDVEIVVFIHKIDKLERRLQDTPFNPLSYKGLREIDGDPQCLDTVKDYIAAIFKAIAANAGRNVRICFTTLRRPEEFSQAILSHALPLV